MGKICDTKLLHVFLLVVFIINLSLLLLGCNCDDSPNGPKPPPPDDRFVGLCYGPHRDNEDPDFGIQPTMNELTEDFALIKNLARKIRTYGITDNLEQIPALCDQYEINCYPGAWISRFECENERQIDNLINIANQSLNHVKGLIVGNEVLLRRDISEQQLLEFISRVKNSTNNIPIATAEIWSDWLEHPQLAEAIDILFVHIYPYWDGVAVEQGANYVLEKWNELKTKYPNKAMVIGETGWPSQGEVRGNAIPSEENQKRYISDFIAMANSHNIDYFYFEIFDEKWKSKFEGEAGSHWGMYYSDGSPKPQLMDLLPDLAKNGINRPPRVVNPTEATLPLFVYKDGCDPLNSFFSSGWMGELATFLGNDTIINTADIIYELSTDNPYSGETCIRISYSPSPGQWGGIYWQYPVNNWGNYPGYDFSNFIEEGDTVRLSFWVRGKEGGEKAEFKTGGINDPTLEYSDSYGPMTTGVLTLTTIWKKYSLDLTGQDLSMVIGGFCWVTNYNQNPNGCTIYLDEIQFSIVTPNSD